MPAPDFPMDDLPDPGDRYCLCERLGGGVYGEVYAATDRQAGGKRVAIKMVYTEAHPQDIRQEVHTLRTACDHPNLPDLYGVYLREERGARRLWMVMEICDGGSVTDLVQGLSAQGRKMAEEHIAYFLKEVVKAGVHLHRHHVVHRDIKGSNVVFTRDGEVRLLDFGLSKTLSSTFGRTGSCLGSPCWMAPEVVSGGDPDAYDNRADVWALGIMAIELGEGRPPLHDMHPSRALFQIVHNPPPTLSQAGTWSGVYCDFVAECLEKNPEHRPYMEELLEHPFLQGVPHNDYHLQQEVRTLWEEVQAAAAPGRGPAVPRSPELVLRSGHLHCASSSDSEELLVEDLAALDEPSEEGVLEVLAERFRRASPYTFVGDVLLALNTNDSLPLYQEQHHEQYQFKSRSDNAPHIYAVADTAYQAVLHHSEGQSVVLGGESGSGKSTQLGHLLDHLAFLGKSEHSPADKVEKGLAIVRAMGNAGTPINGDSTRHVMLLELTFSATGKLSGGIFWVYMLERWRVTSSDREQANFHVFYYFYDAMEAAGTLTRYHLEAGRRYRFLRRPSPPTPSKSAANVRRFRELQQCLRDLELEETVADLLWSGLAAVLLLGEVTFTDGGGGGARLSNPAVAEKVAELLAVDRPKFLWALVNYCEVRRGTAERQRMSPEAAAQARDVLAATLYSRLLDWMVNLVNWRLSFDRALYGDKHSITLVDMAGFECFRRNGLGQLVVNVMNGQMEYLYGERVWGWEQQDVRAEQLPEPDVAFEDNRATLDAVLGKPEGVLALVDASVGDAEAFMASVQQSGRSPYVRVAPQSHPHRHTFMVSHYTGTVSYDAHHVCTNNTDFLPPDMTEVLRQSGTPAVQQLFTGRLDKAGNLTMAATGSMRTRGSNAGGQWAALLANTKRCTKRYNTASRGRFSQEHGLRTAVAVFRALSREVLRALSVGGAHYVRCVRTHLAGQPRGYDSELVRHQLKALRVVDTARVRRVGHPCRVPFEEFIRRYKFLAFDFNEHVAESGDNCRLLLVRLRMEGWAMGSSMVFLTYYNEEYLARLYETQVKKVVRVQTMMRAFLARRNVRRQAQLLTEEHKKEMEKQKKKKKKQRSEPYTEDSAAVVIQKQYRGYRVRKEMGPMLTTQPAKLDADTLAFIRHYCNRWKARTMFQVLLLYRAARCQDLVYLSQQVHVYNQHVISALQACNVSVCVKQIDTTARVHIVLGRVRLPVRKLPFRLCDVPFVDTSALLQPGFSPAEADDAEPWDEPLRRGLPGSELRSTDYCLRDQEVQTCPTSSPQAPQPDGGQQKFIHRPFSRDPQGGAAATSADRNAVYKGRKPQQAETDVSSSRAVRSSMGGSKEPLESRNRAAVPAVGSSSYVPLQSMGSNHGPIPSVGIIHIPSPSAGSSYSRGSIPSIGSSYDPVPSTGSVYGPVPSTGSLYGPVPSTGSLYGPVPSTGSLYGAVPSAGISHGPAPSAGSSYSRGSIPSKGSSYDPVPSTGSVYGPVPSTGSLYGPVPSAGISHGPAPSAGSSYSRGSIPSIGSSYDPVPSTGSVYGPVPSTGISHGPAPSAGSSYGRGPVPSIGSSYDPIPPAGSVYGPVPFSKGQQHDQWDFPKSPSPTRKHYDQNQNQRPAADPMKNPIREMQVRGRRSSAPDEDQEPPFNFQGMLRKTNHKRASLKRSDSGLSLPAERVADRPADRPSDRPADKGRQHGRGNPAVPPASPTKVDRETEMTPPPPAVVYVSTNNNNYTDNMTSLHYQNDNHVIQADWSNDTVTELAPGIMVQGQVAEL